MVLSSSTEDFVPLLLGEATAIGNLSKYSHSPFPRNIPLKSQSWAGSVSTVVPPLEGAGPQSLSVPRKRIVSPFIPFPGMAYIPRTKPFLNVAALQGLNLLTPTCLIPVLTCQKYNFAPFVEHLQGRSTWASLFWTIFLKLTQPHNYSLFFLIIIFKAFFFLSSFFSCLRGGLLPKREDSFSF